MRSWAGMIYKLRDYVHRDKICRPNPFDSSQPIIKKSEPCKSFFFSSIRQLWLWPSVQVDHQRRISPTRGSEQCPGVALHVHVRQTKLIISHGPSPEKDTSQPYCIWRIHLKRSQNLFDSPRQYILEFIILPERIPKNLVKSNSIKRFIASFARSKLRKLNFYISTLIPSPFSFCMIVD